jgi:hypothetical protein
VIREVELGVPVIDQFPAFENDGYSKRSGLLTADFTPTVYRDTSIIALSVAIQEIAGSGEYRISFTPALSGLYEVQVLIDFNKQIWFAQYVAVAELTHDLAEQARDQADKIDLSVINPSTVVDGSLADQLMNKDAARTFSAATDSLEAIADALSASSSAIGIALAQMQVDLTRVLGLLHRNAILDSQTYDSFGQLTFARLRVFDLPVNVPTVPGGNETVGLLHKYEINATYAGLNVVTKFTLTQLL